MMAENNRIQIPSQVTDFHEKSDVGKLEIAESLIVI
jgi:hypothetical protein